MKIAKSLGFTVPLSMLTRVDADEVIERLGGFAVREAGFGPTRKHRLPASGSAHRGEPDAPVTTPHGSPLDAVKCLANVERASAERVAFAARHAARLLSISGTGVICGFHRVPVAAKAAQKKGPAGGAAGP